MTDPWARLGDLEEVGPPRRGQTIRDLVRSMGFAIGVVVVAAASWCVWALAASDGSPARDDAGRVKGTVEVRIEDLEPGDCLREAGEDEAYTLVVVPCGSDHGAEVVERASIDDLEFPGTEVLEGRIGARCQEALAGFVADAGDYDLTFYYPQPADWDRGDREYVCLLTDPEGGRLTGSARQTA